ncbi:hypothetical protein C7S18_07215 [Ahniella affigens]|uniref:Bacterial Ig-like domain-containing protein n=1 Tax=Ahniella affigens TaxID=2021234 RepID=A0A2P1PQ75_9GAMM|nr:Ig-like domain repeat protein [Ahniella affigens]AVP96997.1 hypothetical protein C7S18_07215 [Ahniella affigens]
MNRLTTLFLTLALGAIPTLAVAAQSVITGPAGSGKFGKDVVVLPNGNFVVLDPEFDLNAGAIDVGAVYLYRADGVLISTLRGSATNDRVGSDGVTVLANGNYLIHSPLWNGEEGALSFGRATTGVSGIVSISNSMISAFDIQFGSKASVTVLPNGNFLVRSDSWLDLSLDNPRRIGAIRFVNGQSGGIGTMDESNALVATAVDIGNVNAVSMTTKIYVLTDGNYVMTSEGASVNGAVIWGDAQTGRTGRLSDATWGAFALVGSKDGDGLFMNVLPLANGAYAVEFPYMDVGPTMDVGAVAFVNTPSQRIGVVTSANALFGNTTSDQVGKVTELGNGHCVVNSPLWDDGATPNVGAVTHAPNCAISGFVTAANSLIGGRSNDRIGLKNVTPDNPSHIVVLSDGDYAVMSRYFNRGSVAGAGAVTIVSGTTGMTGVVSEANSVVGSRLNDEVGIDGTALTNGNLVIAAPSWDSPTLANVGAVAWISGTPMTAFELSSSNALVGDQVDDFVGSHGVTALSNGNYVVKSNSWHGQRAAFTWGAGNTGVRGVLTATNSWISPNDEPSNSTRVVTLPNGNYLAINAGYADYSGIIGFGNGGAGLTGMQAPSAFTLVGGPSDGLGIAGGANEPVQVLGNGDFVVGWNGYDGIASNGGAVLYGHSMWDAGFNLPVTGANSLRGAQAQDALGLNVYPQANGNYIVQSRFYDNFASATDAGIVMLARGDGSTVGTPTSSNSVIGIQVNGGDTQNFDYDNTRNQLIVGEPASNRVVRYQPGTATTTQIFQVDPATSAVGSATTITALVTSNAAPALGTVRIYASTGESCTDESPIDWTSDTAAFACSITFLTPGARTLHAEFTGSWTQGFSRSANVNHTAQSPDIFRNGFE